MNSVIFKIGAVGLALLLGASEAKSDAYPELVTVNPRTLEKVMLYQEKLYDQRTYARAYVLQKVYEADSRFEQIRTQYPIVRRDYLMSAYEHAKGEVVAQQWSGGWTSIGLKAGVVGGITYGGIVIGTGGTALVAAPVLLAMGGSILTDVVDKKMKDFEKAPPTKSMTGEVVVMTNVWGDLQKESGDSVLRDISIRSKEEIMGRSDTIPDSLDRDLIARKRNDKHEKDQSANKVSLDALQRSVSALRNGTITKKQYLELKEELIKRFEILEEEALEARKNLRQISDHISQQQESDRRAAQRENISAMFSFGAGVAVLFNDQKAAYMFNKAAQLGATLHDISGITTKMLKEKPWVCANLYLAAATLTIELVKGAQKTEFEMTMEALQQISKQINELRVEMHARFDRLEQRMDYYFGVVLLNLRDIAASQQLIARTVERMHADMSRLQNSLDNGLNDLAKINLNKWQSDCFGLQSNKVPYRITEDKIANECFSQYMLLGSGDYAAALLLSSPEKGAQVETHFDKYSFNKLAELIYQQGGVMPKRIYSPSQFKYGANQTLRLLYRNPKYSSVTSDPLFRQLIDNGESFQKFEENMVLEKGFGKYKLRRSIFKKLLEQYKEGVMDAWTAATNAVSGVKGVGPIPGKKWSTPVDEDTLQHFQMLKVPLTFCSDSKLESGYFEQINYTKDIDQRRWRPYVHNLDKMFLSKEFFPLLPQSVVWANRMNGLKTRINGCLRKAKIPYLRTIQDDFRTTYELELVLDINVTYSVFNPKTKKDEEKTFLVTRLSGQKREAGVMMDPAWGLGILEAAWTGATQRTDIATRLMVTGKDIAGITNAPKKFFTQVVMTDEMGEDLAEFEAQFSDLLEGRQREAIQTTDDNSLGPQKDVASILWQLTYLLRNGIHLSNKPASELYGMLMSGYLPRVDQVIRWGITTGGDARAVSDMLDARIAGIYEKLNEMECSVLKPAPSSIYPYVIALKAKLPAEEKQCKYLPNWMCL